MANAFFNIPVPTTDGVGAGVDVSSILAQRSIGVDSGDFDGEIVLEGSNDGGAHFEGIPGMPAFRAGQVAIQVRTSFQFVRARRRGGSTFGAPQMRIGGEQGSTVFVTPAVPTADGVGAASDISGGGAVQTIVVSGSFTGRLVIEMANDAALNFAPVAAFTAAGVVTIEGIASAVRVRRVGALGGAAPVVGVGSCDAFGGDVGGGFPGFGGAPPAIAGASSAGAAGTASRSDHTHALDLVNYTPSLVAMQGTGLVAQTAFAAGVATLGLVAIPTAFPGFGGAPPAIATASAAGAAGTASRSDHTHALDLVAYNPSLAGMQATGVVQQAYGAPTATPSVLTMVNTQIPFGAPSGVLTQSSAITYTDTAATRTLKIITDPTAVAPARFNPLTFDTSAAPVAATTVGIAWALQGTQSMRWVQATQASGTVCNLSAIFRNDLQPGITSALLTVGTQTLVGGLNAGFVYDFLNADVRVGTNTPIAAAANTHGFFWLGANYGATVPTGVPVSNVGTVGTGAATAFAIGETNRQLWGYLNGGWHYASFYDYTTTATRIPFGSATALALTDSAAFTFTTGTGTLNVNSIASIAGTGLTLAATGAQSMTFQTNATTRGTISSAGVWTIAGSGAVAPGGTFGNLTWNPATAALALGAAGAPPSVGTLLINTSTGSGLNIGGGLTAGLIVRDAGAGGEANIAADTGFLGQRLIGWQSGALTGLELGVGTGVAGILQLTYAAARNGGGTSALEIDGTTGVLVAGASAASGLTGLTLNPSAGGLAADLMLGNSGGLAAAATHGFPYMPERNGRPTGAPNAFGNNGAAFIFDDSSERLWIRDVRNGAWAPLPAFFATAAAGAGVALINNAPGAIVSLNAKWWQFVDAAGVQTFIPFFQ